MLSLQRLIASPIHPFESGCSTTLTAEVCSCQAVLVVRFHPSSQSIHDLVCDVTLRSTLNCCDLTSWRPVFDVIKCCNFLPRVVQEHFLSLSQAANWIARAHNPAFLSFTSFITISFHIAPHISTTPVTQAITGEDHCTYLDNSRRFVTKAEVRTGSSHHI